MSVTLKAGVVVEIYANEVADIKIAICDSMGLHVMHFV